MTRKSKIPGSGGAKVTGTGRRLVLARRWLPWVALAYLLTAGLFVAWAKMETTQLTYEVHRLRAERAELAREQRQLGIQVAGLRSPAYLTEKASELGMAVPSPDLKIRVE